jgi:hypothetical protein
MTTKEAVLGTYAWQQDTKNGIHRFYREDENGRTQLQYVVPAVFDGEPRPDEIEVVVRWARSKPAAARKSTSNATASRRRG